MGDWGGKVIAGKGGVSRLLLLIAGVLMVVAAVADGR
jgi:hypothetical protein